jgi:transposase
VRRYARPWPRRSARMECCCCAIYAHVTARWLREVPAAETLRRVWVQQFLVTDNVVRWRTETDGIPPSFLFISSPYDVDDHYAKKDTTQWVGYKIHVTETCEDDLPHLITHVETTGPNADGDVTPRIHADLQEKDVLPNTHIVDTGFPDATLLVDNQTTYGVDLFGPTRRDYHWQARAGEGFDAQHFAIDSKHQQATCPAGQTSLSWTPAVDNRDSDVIKIKFSSSDCAACESRTRSTRSTKTYQRRTLTVRPQKQYEALRAARRREAEPAFAKTHVARAGIEGTNSRGIRTCEMRRTAYLGLAKTHLGHVLTDVALNFLRLGEWFAEIPHSKNRVFPFVHLMNLPLFA